MPGNNCQTQCGCPTRSLMQSIPLFRTWARQVGALEPLKGLRLRNAMGSSCAWHQDGLHIALTFTSGDIVVVVSHLTLPHVAIVLQPYA